MLFEQDKNVNPKLQSFFLPKNIVDTRRKDKDMYHDFISCFVKPVVGKRKFDSNCIKYLFSRYVTVSDEAFALLTFENNYERWLDMALKNNWASSDIKPLYSTGGNGNQTPSKAQGKQKTKDNDSSATMYQGWSKQGIRRFNALYDLITEERSTRAGFLFEEEFLQYMQEKKNMARKKDRKEKEYELCRHDLWATGDDINDVSTAAAVLESGHYINTIKFFETNGDKLNKSADEASDDEENDDDNSSASSIGFKNVVGI